MKSIALAAITLGAAFSAVHAQSTTDSWTINGGAWTPADQAAYVASAGGILYDDAAIAASTNTSPLNTNPTLTTGSITGGGGGLGTSFIYTANSTPVFTYSSTSVLDDVQTITMSLTVAVSTFTQNSMTLSLGVSPASFTSVDTGAKVAGFEAFTDTWTWDVSSLSSFNNFNISWTTAASHSAYTAVEVTQSTEAVPEPSTWALLAAAPALLLWVNRRRLAGSRL